MLDLESALFLDPMEDFVNAHLRAYRPGDRRDRLPRHGALFNDDLHDSHFSAAGSEVWAEAVGRRLVPVLGEYWQGRGEDASGHDRGDESL
jgi:hypothetical protein